MKYGQNNLNTWTDFQGERDRGQRWLRQGGKPVGRPDFIRDFRAGENQLGEVLSPDRGFMQLAAALAEQGTGGKTLVLMLAAAMVGAGVTAALTSHPVSASETSSGQFLSDCPPLAHEQITGGLDTSRFPGFRSAPSVPNAESMACWETQMETADDDKILQPNDVVTWEKIQALMRIKPEIQWSDGPTADVAGNELAPMSPAKELAETMWDQIVLMVVEDLGKDPKNSAEVSAVERAYAGEIGRIYADLTKGLGFAGWRNSRVIDTCLTVMKPAASRAGQKEAIVPVRYQPGIEIGAERIEAGKDKRSNKANLDALFKIAATPAEAADIRQVLRAKKIFFNESRLLSGVAVFSIVIDTESEGPGIEFADRPNLNQVGDLAQLVPCGPAQPKPTETPAPTQTPTPTQVQIQEATQVPSGGGGGGGGGEQQQQQKGNDSYDTGGSVEQGQANRENKGTGGTAGNEDTKPDEP